MRKIILLTLLQIIGLNLCNSQTFNIQENYTVVKEIFGDLDGDGINEQLLICNTDEYGEEPSQGLKRKIYILKEAPNKERILWKENSTILWNSKQCGFCFDDVKDDPLLYAEIKNNTLIIKQKRYNNTRRLEELKQIFRFQNNDWFLIGSKYRYADTCDFDTTYDINFSTNEILLTEISHNCEEHEGQKDSYSKRKFNYNFSKITMDTYKPTSMEISKNVTIWF